MPKRDCPSFPRPAPRSGRRAGAAPRARDRRPPTAVVTNERCGPGTLAGPAPRGDPDRTAAHELLRPHRDPRRGRPGGRRPLRAGRAPDTAVLAGIGALGLLDDLLEPHMRRAGRPVSKGLRGHLGALRSGRLTTGALKAAGIPLLALAGAAASPAPRGGAMVLADAALTAGCANLANLLDLRPGRALKVILPAAALLAAPAAAGSARAATGTHLGRAALLPALVALPPDLREHAMLGDAGANVLGAAVGTAAARSTAP